MNSSVFQVISNKKQEKEQNPPFSKKKSKSPSCIGYILLAKFLRILNGKVTQLEKPPGWRSPTSPFISGHVSFHHPPKRPPTRRIQFPPEKRRIDGRTIPSPQIGLPIPSMYGIFTYIWLIFVVNVGEYTIHGWVWVVNIIPDS